MSSSQVEASGCGRELGWQDMAGLYQCPQWFCDAKFGLWAHWGASSVPRLGSGWYPKHMYLEDVGTETFGANAFSHHRQTYGHQSQFGFKDICNLWRAEKFDADATLRQWREWGARYAAILANFHDGFDNWNSNHQDWNAVKVGPHRDIVGEFAAAARRHGLPWVATIHDVDWVRNFLMGAHGADREGPLKGVPYDGILTKADGAGKWWEGLDPAQLYGPPPALRTEEWKAQDNRAWLARHQQLIRDYRPDALYFDGEIPYGQEGETLCAEFYRESLARHGSIQAIVQVKNTAPGTLHDIERGGANTLQEAPWQTDTSLAYAWFLKYDEPHWHNARTVLESLCDIVSKNGNLLLSLGLYPDGTLPEDQTREMNIVGAWLKRNGEAVYGSRPWRVFRDGSGVQSGTAPAGNADPAGPGMPEAPPQEQTEHFNERTVKSPPFHHDEVRFTTRGGRLFVFVLNPAPGELKIPALGTHSPARPGAIRRATLLADGSVVPFRQDGDALRIVLPGGIPTGLPLTIALEGVNP